MYFDYTSKIIGINVVFSGIDDKKCLRNAF